MIATVIGEAHPETYCELIQFWQLIIIYNCAILIKRKLLNATTVTDVEWGACKTEGRIFDRLVTEAVWLVVIFLIIVQS